MRRSVILAALASSLLAVGGVCAWQKTDGKNPGNAMSQAASEWLQSLSDDQRAKVVMDYDSPQRLDWHFIPKPTRKGLQVKEMEAAQRKAALQLLRTSLGQAGYDKASRIMAIEAVLRELEKTREGTPIRDPERYYFTVFGKPSEKDRWGLSIEGHHMSLNFVVENGKVVSSTPLMFGANPATLKGDEIAGFKPGTRILAKEEEIAFELVNHLSGDQRTTAIIDEQAPKEVRNDGKPQPPTDAPAGLAAEKMNADQQKLLKSLIATYAANVPDEVARQRLGDIEKSGFNKVHFAWAGATRPGVGHYYRIQGDTFLIEFVNTQPDSAGNPANHIHCLWRDVRGDFAIPISG